MNKQITYINTGQSKIIDLDADDQGNFIAFTDNNGVITNDHHIVIETDIRSPKIRRLDFDKFIIIGTRNDDGPENGVIYNFNGEKLLSFYAGYYINNIIVHRQRIIITYLDQGGLFGPNGLEEEGLSIFDFEGNFKFGFSSEQSDSEILDCYCICKFGENKILFYYYTYDSDFKICELNIDTNKFKVSNPPDDFLGASAISSKDNLSIMHGTYNDKSSFYMWDRKSGQVVKTGEYTGTLEGVNNGKFLSFEDNQYTVIDLLE